MSDAAPKRPRRVDMARVKRVLIEATGPNKEWTRRSLSLAAGLGPDGIRNILSGRSGNPRAGTLEGIAEALGKSVTVFFAEADDEPASGPQAEFVDVIGAVAAGVWREQTEWRESDRYQIAVGPSPYPKVPRFALLLEGLSMNRLFQPGTVLDCLRVNGRMQPQLGDLVIAERARHDLYEMTCKRLARNDDTGDYELLCESTEPEFQDPIPVGALDPEGATQDSTRIIGIVIGSYTSHLRPRR